MMQTNRFTESTLASPRCLAMMQTNRFYQIFSLLRTHAWISNVCSLHIWKSSIFVNAGLQDHNLSMNILVFVVFQTADPRGAGDDADADVTEEDPVWYVDVMS